MKRIGVFCDVSNLYYCIGNRFNGKKLDYKGFLNFIKDLGEIQQAVAYGSQMRNEAHPFIKALKSVGFVTKFKKPKEFANGRKSDWDVGIAVDMISMMGALDMVILGSADSDMAPAVAYIMNKGIKVLVFACGVSRELHETGAEIIEVTESMLETTKMDSEAT